MGRWQCKNTLNNIKINMAAPHTGGPNTNETEENDLKNTFIKMMEALKEKMKNPLKEMEEKTNKKLQETNKSLKESQEKAIK